MSATTAQNKETLQFVRDHFVTGDRAITIRDVVGMMPAHVLRQTSDPLLGIITFHGKRVPVIDLRMNFIMGIHSGNEQICILAAEVDRRKTPLLIGALLDSETDAYELIMATTH